MYEARENKTPSFSRFCFFIAIWGQKGDIMLYIHNIIMYLLAMSVEMYFSPYSHENIHIHIYIIYIWGQKGDIMLYTQQVYVLTRYVSLNVV